MEKTVHYKLNKFKPKRKFDLNQMYRKAGVVPGVRN